MKHTNKRQGDIATTRRTTKRRYTCFAGDKTTVRQRAVLRVSLATGRKGDNDLGCVFYFNNFKQTCYINGFLFSPSFFFSFFKKLISV
jgi:hypothetical protein